VEGAETRVLADDTEVQNYMIGLGESLEQVRGMCACKCAWRSIDPPLVLCGLDVCVGVCALLDINTFHHRC
jgi:hypothetical protein